MQILHTSDERILDTFSFLCFVSSALFVIGNQVEHVIKYGKMRTPYGLFITILLLFCVEPLNGISHPADKSAVNKGKICIGTKGRMSVPSNRQHHYRNLRERYTNCSYVDGNLELTWIQDENVDLSFLQNIREVTGYVLISHVHVNKVVLPNLQIIRGRTLFRLSVHQQEFALLITLCKAHTIEMPALRDILSGGVGLFDNYNLCHIRTINWQEIITGPGFTDVYVYNFTLPERNCLCDKSCSAGCWGEGPENCQKFSKINCSPQCSKGRCFGNNPRECCHLFCAGGCTGPKQTDCLACRNFYDDGECTQECPSMQTYNPSTYSWEYNPRGKYAYGATCVKNCPEHLLKDNGACVRSCPPNKRPVNGECVSCDGACPKSCKVEGSIHSGNVDGFKGCTVIDGSISILDHSFAGFQHMDETNGTFGPRYGQMHPDRLEVFSTLKEVTGFINIQGSHPDFKNLSYFRNLEVIGGRSLTEVYSLYIVKTSLTSLGLQSLKKISAGGIAILENSRLCFAEGVEWKNIKNPAVSSANDYISRNRPKSECAADGMVCDPQCSLEGCWGPGPNQCISCINFKSGNECVEDCNAIAGMYTAEPKLCKPCHEECADSCNGPGNGNCTRCKHVQDGPFCYASCPETKYNDNGECKPCHPSCVNGCTGPANKIGPGGCLSCEKAIINGDVTVESCLPKDEPCPTGYYYEWVGPQDQGPLKPLAGKAICRKCHPRCKKCTGYGIHVKVCQECTNYKKGEQCEDECPQDYYADEATQECLPCSSECKGCYGPEPSHCFTCRNFKLYLDGKDPRGNDTAFNCTSVCPPEASHKIFPDDDPQPYCSSQPIGPLSQFAGPTQWRDFIIIIVVLLVSVIVVFFFFYRWRTKMKAKEEQVKMTRVMTGLEDNEPLRPSNVKPNLAKLRIVKEADMRKGGILGFGAFGTVYKGVWVPEGENVKIPVAIKVLREGTSANTSKEFLEEAYIMASVEHPNLLQLLAVCMTSQMMLVTQLMPLGNLLDYVRNHKERIGSKPLLNWCTQIAKGMAYLEEKRLVHRDLAARNVLVQTPNCVKITDFGLAKLLDINEEVYKAGGGKMPIKWLALECILHRIFTHKSDVWAFGVTVWELLTYGERPYENVPARDVPELLEKGERLPQPAICTIDVYMTMVKCWMLNADSRPAFKELADDFAKMARDPGRYLVIQGDKFLKLPSYSVQQERRDLMHTLSTGTSDGPETIMEADEYLQPQIQRPAILRGHPSSSTSSTPPVTPTLKQVAESPIPQNQHNWDRELLRYSQSHSGQSGTMPTRYCADPLRLGKDVGLDDCFDSKPATIGDLKLNLPLDEDDYLMPSPQQNQITTTYMDIIGDNKSTDDTDYRNGGFPRGAYQGNGSDKLKTCVDNPEYIMNSDRTEGDIGIPVVGTNGKSVGINVANLPSNVPRPYLAQKSSEEESDHEYYNDIDRLQRELQPLRRNETTV